MGFLVAGGNVVIPGVLITPYSLCVAYCTFPGWQLKARS